MKLFKLIQIETNSFCTRKCIFCPKYKDERKEIVELPMETIHKIVDELKELKYDGIVELDNYNEPTFDKRLPEIIKYIRDNLPYCSINLHTNGDIYKIPEQYIKLFESGATGIEINLYDEDNKETLTEIYNKVKIMYGEDKFEDGLCWWVKRQYGDNYKKEDFEGQHPDVSLTPNIFSKPKKGYKKFFLIDKTNFGKLRSIHKIRNRAGNIPWIIPNIKKSLNKICSFPFKNFVIRASGNIALCCDDYYNEGNIGNINNNTISEIWFGEKLTEYRKRLYNKNRNIIPCNRCNKSERTMIFHIYKNWKELEEKIEKNNKSLFDF